MDLLAVPEVAEQLGVPVTRVQQFIRDGQLVATRIEGGPRGVPALFVQDGAIVKSLPSVITMLRDARFTDEEIIDWLHRRDDSLPGSPVEALRANRGSEIKRRAQVAGY
ncbi:MAG: Rv2175c family DNA-binding protein [Jatrophihabitantaceae bacterium]